MASRYYLSQLVGTGTLDDPFRPAVAVLVSAEWSGCDGRADATVAIGQMMIAANVTPSQHSALVADPRVTALQLEDAVGNALDASDTLGTIPPAKRTATQNSLETQGVPTQGLSLADLVFAILQRCVRRFLLRQILTSDDFSEGLDTLVSAVATIKRQNIANKLRSQGFDTSVISGTDTIREAVRKIQRQAVKSFSLVGAA